MPKINIVENHYFEKFHFRQSVRYRTLCVRFCSAMYNAVTLFSSMADLTKSRPFFLSTSSICLRLIIPNLSLILVHFIKKLYDDYTSFDPEVLHISWQLHLLSPFFLQISCFFLPSSSLFILND